MILTENADLRWLQKYYTASTLFLLITASLGAWHFLGQFMHFNSGSTLVAATVHTGTLGVITIGLFGMYLRIFSTVRGVHVSHTALKILYRLMVSGVVILFFGLLITNMIILGIAAMLVIIAVIWWNINYIQLFNQAPKADRGGVLQFGLFGSIGLLVAVLYGGYLLHGYVTHTMSFTSKLAHIHAGLVGWASMGLLGVGIAFRGGEQPVTGSIGLLRTTAWGWLAGFGFLIIFMTVKQISWLILPAVLLLLAFFAYGYSMPKVGQLGKETSDDSASISGVMLFIILGFIGLFMVIALGFDVSMNYPAGQVGLHSIAGVGAWLLMMILVSMLSEFPKVSYTLLKSQLGETIPPDKSEYYNLPGIKIFWLLLLVGLVGYIIGNYTSIIVRSISGFVIAVTVMGITLGLLIKYRVR